MRLTSEQLRQQFPSKSARKSLLREMLTECVIRSRPSIRGRFRSHSACCLLIWGVVIGTSGCAAHRSQVTQSLTPTSNAQRPEVQVVESELYDNVRSGEVSSRKVMPIGYVVETLQVDDDKSASDQTESKTGPQAEITTTLAPDSTAGRSIVASGPQGMTLDDFELIAMSNNPTIRQLAATTQKAAGFRQQVGLRSNPTVGYQGMQIADQGTDQHTAFVEQEFVTGNKLALNRAVMNEALRAQLFELEAQKYRVQTDVRVKFYAALAAQQQVALTSEFQTVGKTAFDIAELRKRAMEASQVEVLQAKIQMNQIDLAKQQAEVTYAAAWRELAALIGDPNLQPVRLEGELAAQVQPVDWDVARTTILAGSPEYMAAQTRVRQARVNLERQGVQAIPNITAQLASGYDNGTDSGMINLQVGAPIPVFNQNQGNIVAARAEYCRAMMEVSRIENAIQARLAVVSNDFDTALAAVEKYQYEILPSARETLQLAEQAYKAGEFSFIEVLTVRRTYFESNLQMLHSHAQLAKANAQVNGFVLSGGLDATIDQSGDDSLRGLTFSQQ